MSDRMKTIFLAVGLFIGLSDSSMSAGLTNRVEIKPGLNFEVVKTVGDSRSASLAFTNRFNAGDSLTYLVTNSSVHVLNVARIHPKEKQFEFHLFSEGGHEVQKTELGLENSKEVALTETSRQLNLRFWPMKPGGGLADHLFVPDEYFVITNKGVYTLDVRVRLWTQRTNGQYGVVISPPVRVQIEKH